MEYILVFLFHELHYLLETGHASWTNHVFRRLVTLALLCPLPEITWVRRSSRKSSATHSYQCV